jgi:hypothetical protein
MSKVKRRKIETNLTGLKYLQTWKCHKETPCVAILNNQKLHLLILFLHKIEQEGRTGSACVRERLVSVGGRRGREMVKKCEYGKNVMYT